MALTSTSSVVVTVTMFMETALDVCNLLAARTEVSFSPATIFVLAVSAFVISLSVFGFLREAHKHIRNPSGRRVSLPTGLGSAPPDEEEWEESPRKEEESSAS